MTVQSEPWMGGIQSKSPRRRSSCCLDNRRPMPWNWRARHRSFKLIMLRPSGQTVFRHSQLCKGPAVDKWTELQVFCKVAELSSLSKAADVMGMSVSSTRPGGPPAIPVS